LASLDLSWNSPFARSVIYDWLKFRIKAETALVYAFEKKCREALWHKHIALNGSIPIRCPWNWCEASSSRVRVNVILRNIWGEFPLCGFL
jgi:hypothetical protein